jgi:hypothetical protein
VEFGLAFPLGLTSQSAARSNVCSSIVCKSILSECHPALIKIDTGFSPVALSTYIEAMIRLKKVSACNITIVQLREFPERIFLIWHRIPGGRMRRMK